MTDIGNPINPIPRQKRILRRCEIAFWAVAILLGFFHTWSDHHYLLNSDALSYLDIAESYMRRDWQNALNSYWSPLYSWLLALTFLVIKPTPYWKFAVLHLVNFSIYVFALGCFGFLMREIIQRNRSRNTRLSATGFMTLPDLALLALGYSLFIWTSLFLITVRLESPDMLVAAFMYLAAAILLRIGSQPSGWGIFLLLGIVLGFGFLAKSVMLPMSLVFLVLSVFSGRNVRSALPRVALALAAFALVAGPFVFALSRSKGHLTTGGSGKLNYLWSINRVTNTHWQGEEPSKGVPIHPTRKIFDSPPAFEFGEPVGGTYPVWYDPTYWYEGSVSQFDFRQQVRVLLEAVESYYELFQKMGIQSGLLVGLASLLLMSGDPRRVVQDVVEQWPLILTAIAGMGLYALVHVQGRYVASQLLLLWIGFFSAVRVKRSSESERLIKTISIVLAAMMLFINVGSSTKEAALTVRQLVIGEDPSAHEQWQVAEGLREDGLQAHDRVAFIGRSTRAFWAHLLGIRIVAEIRRDKVAQYWEADPQTRANLINAFADTGVKAVVAENPPGCTDLTGWQRVRQTDYYVRVLK